MNERGRTIKSPLWSNHGDILLPCSGHKEKITVLYENIMDKTKDKKVYNDSSGRLNRIVSP